MKSRVMLAAALILTASATFAETPDDCFPACAPATPAAVEPAQDVPAAAATACSESLVTKVEALNDQVKPIREIVGYVRTPQGLAMKLVNDHIVKIPAWVGFALDPVGSIKHRAIDEVRSRAKTAMGINNSCRDAQFPPESLSIDAA